MRLRKLRLVGFKSFVDPTTIDLEAANGAEALEQVGRYRAHMVLLDVMMPVMDGYATAKKLNDDLHIRPIPIIMLTVLDDREARLEGLKCGASAITRGFWPIGSAWMTSSVKPSSMPAPCTISARFGIPDHMAYDIDGL